MRYVVIARSPDIQMWGDGSKTRERQPLFWGNLNECQDFIARAQRMTDWSFKVHELKD